MAKGDQQSLVKVMSHLLAVRERQGATDRMFEPLQDTIMLLERYGVTIPDHVFSQMEVGKEEVIIYSKSENQNYVYSFCVAS